MRHLLSIDIGATNLKIALFDCRTKRISSLQVQKTDPRDFLGQIYGAIDRMPTFEGIGVALPGLLDQKRRTWLYSPNIRSVKNLKLAQILERKYGIPVVLSNDAVAAVMGERTFGAGKGVNNLVYITFSTGIGAGIIADGRPIFGKAGGAHEIGHTTIDIHDGQRCSCGSYGHWEAYCSGRGIPKFAKHLLTTKYRSSPSVLRKMRTVTAPALFDAAKSDKVAASIVDDIGRINAMGVANAINLYDPELVSIGGGIALANPDAVIGPIRKYVKGYLFNEAARIIVTPLKENAALYGAVVELVK